MLVDIGINLTNSSFQPDLDEVIERANQNQVGKLIITGTSEEESKQALSLAQQYQQFCTAGIHPHDAKDASENYVAELTELAKHSQVVAIGECGLDFNRNYSPPETQKLVFSQQLALSKQLDLPAFLHERDAFDTQLGLLKEYQIENAVTHCFTGDTQQLKAYLDLGFYIGIAGWVCDERRGSELREAVKYLPMDRLLLETDGPYLWPRTLKPRKRRNEPANLPHIAEQLATILAVDKQDLIQSSYNNSVTLFNLT